MQGFLVVAPVLFCLTQAAPQSNLEYDPNEADSYIEANPYKYDPDNNGKPWSFNYEPDNDSNSFKYDPSSGVAYNYAYDPKKDTYKYTYDPSKQQSFDTSNLEDLIGTLQTISKSKLLGDSLKDCRAINDLPEAIEETNEAVSTRRGEIESAFNGLVRARDSQQEPGDTVRQVSSALGAIEPLIPVFTKLLNFNNEGCKIDLSSRKKRQAFDACENPTELSKDVFLGVADLLELTAEFNTENPGRYNLDTNEIQEQAELIRDGADILQDVNLTPLVSAVTLNTDCPTQLSELKTTLTDLADLVDLFTPEEKTQTAAAPVAEIIVQRTALPASPSTRVAIPSFPRASVASAVPTFISQPRVASPVVPQRFVHVQRPQFPQAYVPQVYY